jgi:transmembrane sensor
MPKLFQQVEVDTVAARWANRIDGPSLSDAEHADFVRWLTDNPAHEREFLRYRSLIALAAQLRGDPRYPLKSWPVVAPRAPLRRSGAVWGFTAAALVLIVSGALILLAARAPLPQRLATAAGEIRKVRLGDGTTAYLDTATHLEWSEAPHERDVDLLSGRVLFDVIHDPAKPFVVRVANTQIRVVGTQFYVSRQTDRISLTVQSGTVEVSGPPEYPWKRVLHSNEHLIYQAAGVTQDVHTTAAVREAKWAEYRLDIENETLQEVVAQLSRYTTIPITLDPSLAQIRIVSTFDLHDIPAALAQLQTVARVRLARTPAGFAVQPMTQTPERLPPASEAPQ